nr:hypothetical protein [uncultured Vagococcus sp.]
MAIHKVNQLGTIPIKDYLMSKGSFCQLPLINLMMAVSIVGASLTPSLIMATLP